MSAEIQSRFTFPYPTDTMEQLRRAIISLMSDGVPRSVVEIQDALGTRKDIGARVRELRTPTYGAYCFNDSRRDGPMDDGVFRYVMRIK